jgi:predicted DNA-binding transcriptional regulator AlpA
VDQVQKTAPEPSELKLDAAHGDLVIAATSKAKTAALMTALRLPDQAQQSPYMSRGPPDPARPWLLSDRDVAIALRLSRASVWRHAASGKIPKPLKIGGAARWVSAEIEAVVLRAMAERGEGS